MKRILIVDDEEHILELLEYNLQQEGYKPITADTGEKALELIEAEEIDLVLLDWMLPGIDGIDVLKSIRSSSNNSKLPVILLTAKGDEISKVVGLEIGADDYLSKPFGIHELMARIKAVLRRSDVKYTRDEDDEGRIVMNNLEINLSRRTVSVDDEPVELSYKEFELLYLLAKNQGKVLSIKTIYESVWLQEFLNSENTVMFHISNLRSKLEIDVKNPIYLKVVWGEGYMVE